MKGCGHPARTPASKQGGSPSVATTHRIMRLTTLLGACQRFAANVRTKPRTQAQTLAERIKTHAETCFRFLDDDRIEPTNNKAERALRHAVIDRRITQVARGENGSRWLAHNASTSAAPSALSCVTTCLTLRPSFRRVQLRSTSMHWAPSTASTAARRRKCNSPSI